MKYYNIAIDGPAGAGKSSIAKKLAKKLDFIYVDTGAMYRAMALHIINNKVDPSDEERVAHASESADITIEYRQGAQFVLLNDVDVSVEIREEEVGNTASITSGYLKVREKLLELQRNLANTSNVVMDGRDIGTNILPNADLKIYLTASSKERAQRRWLQLRESGLDTDINEIEKDIINRDKRDMYRAVAPLKQAEDAKLIDSSELSIKEVLETIIDYYEKVC